MQTINTLWNNNNYYLGIVVLYLNFAPEFSIIPESNIIEYEQFKP